MSGYNVLFVLVIVAALGITSWVLAPKGANQTCAFPVFQRGCAETETTGFRLIRTSSLLALACCYLMWMLTYMAQLHPLISTHRLPSKNPKKRCLIPSEPTCFGLFRTSHRRRIRVNRRPRWVLIRLHRVSPSFLPQVLSAEVVELLRFL